MINNQLAEKMLKDLVSPATDYTLKGKSWIYREGSERPVAYAEPDKILHVLYLCHEMKRGNVTPKYIHDVASWFSMCVSLVTYHSDWHKYEGDKRIYELSDRRKKKVYDYVQSIVYNIRYAGEGYYSCEIKPFVTPDKG